MREKLSEAMLVKRELQSSILYVVKEDPSNFRAPALVGRMTTTKFPCVFKADGVDLAARIE